MNIPHDKFCVLPWVSLETSPIGTVRPCCLAEDEIVDDLGKKFDLNSANFLDIQNSQYMQNLRQQFLDQQQPRTCRKCWREENSGRTSKRMHTLDRLKHMIKDEHWSVDAKPLLFLDLKLGNICNLKCRICGSWSSSTFAAEELAKVKADEDIMTSTGWKSSYHYEMLKKGSWPRNNPTFWKEIQQVASQIRYIEFTGGEPFMIQEHFDMLRALVDQGIAGNIEIHYNTNGTQWPSSAADIWQHFKLVEIAFSIDDLSNRFEYQRTNALWHEVNNNIVKFRDLRDQHSNIQLQVCSTVNVFNVIYLESLAQWIDQQRFDFVYWNMLHEAYYFSVATMPETAKALAISRLQEAQVSYHHRKEFDKIADFIRNGVSLDGNLLRMKIADLDRKRQSDLRSHHILLADAISYQGPYG